MSDSEFKPPGKQSYNLENDSDDSDDVFNIYKGKTENISNDHYLKINNDSSRQNDYNEKRSRKNVIYCTIIKMLVKFFYY